MKIGVVGDVHWCSYSSIVRSHGQKYSTRLENLIQCVNWAEKKLNRCDIIVYLGDFFDRSDLNAQEITALKEVKWNGKEHFFLLGNHEKYGGGDFNSLNSLYLSEKFHIITSPYKLQCSNDDISFLPYDRYQKPLTEILPISKNEIIFSHNDIKGIQYGGFLSQEGIDIEEINNNCLLFINGHLHNHQEIGQHLINLGNLTGQNFSEDAFKYKHYIMILDTITLQIDYYKNPYAMNFYKLDLIDSLDPLNNVENNAVISVSIPDIYIDTLKERLRLQTNILENRIRVISTKKDVHEIGQNHLKNDFGSIDHFYNFLSENNVSIDKQFVYEVLK